MVWRVCIHTRQIWEISNNGAIIEEDNLINAKRMRLSTLTVADAGILKQLIFFSIQLE